MAGYPSSTSRSSVSSLRRHSVPQNLARSCAGEAIAFPGDLAIHDNVAIALGTLHTAPFVTRHIVDDLDRQHLQLVKVVDNDVGGSALAQETAILEAGAKCGQPRHPPVDVFERHPFLLANEPDQAFSGIASSGE